MKFKDGCKKKNFKAVHLCIDSLVYRKGIIYYILVKLLYFYSICSVAYTFIAIKHSGIITGNEKAS